jgi:MIP family channel proteins
VNFKKFLTEFIGTFALVFIGAGAAALGVGGLVGVAFAHGLVILSFVHAYGHISGTHINPAVTFGVALSGALSWGQAALYWFAQLLGGAAAGGAMVFVFGGASNGLGATVLADGVSPLQGLVLEAILTFFLVNAVLQGAVRGKAGEFAGLAIGMTLTLSILMGGPLTGASLNPARTFGPALFTGTLNQFWIYLAGTFAGAALAAGVDWVLKRE